MCYLEGDTIRIYSSSDVPSAILKDICKKYPHIWANIFYPRGIIEVRGMYRIGKYKKPYRIAFKNFIRNFRRLFHHRYYESPNKSFIINLLITYEKDLPPFIIINHRRVDDERQKH